MENYQPGPENSTLSIWLVAKGRTKPMPRDCKGSRPSTSIFLFRPWAWSSRVWLTPNQSTFLIVTPNWRDSSRTLLEVTPKQSWLPTLALQITIMTKQWALSDMLLRPRRSRTSQRSMRTRKMLWLESINRKLKGWKGCLKENCRWKGWSSRERLSGSPKTFLLGCRKRKRSYKSRRKTFWERIWSLRTNYWSANLRCKSRRNKRSSSKSSWQSNSKRWRRNCFMETS